MIARKNLFAIHFKDLFEVAEKNNKGRFTSKMLPKPLHQYFNEFEFLYLSFNYEFYDDKNLLEFRVEYGRGHSWVRAKFLGKLDSHGEFIYWCNGIYFHERVGRTIELLPDSDSDEEYKELKDYFKSKYEKVNCLELLKECLVTGVGDRYWGKEGHVWYRAFKNTYDEVF